MIRSSVTRIVLAASVLLATQTALMAQTGTAPAKIGVVDLQAAMVSTQEGQAATARLQTSFVQPRTAELEAMQTELREMTDRLTRGANTMSATAKDDLQRDIDNKTKVFNRSVEDYQADSTDQERMLVDDLSSKMRVVISSFLQENGYSILLDARNPNSGLVWASEGIDITTDIIAAYDKVHPVAAAAAPAAPAPAAPVTPAPVQPGTPATPAQ